MSSCAKLLTVLLVLFPLSVQSQTQTVKKSQPSDPPTYIPEFARIAGVRVSVDTMRKLERRLGKGLAVTGGHPHGARLWHPKGTGWLIHADGFDYPEDNFRRGAVI